MSELTDGLLLAIMPNRYAERMAQEQTALLELYSMLKMVYPHLGITLAHLEKVKQQARYWYEVLATGEEQAIARFVALLGLTPITPHLLAQLARAIRAQTRLAFTITRVEEYPVEALYDQHCEQCSRYDGWDKWVARTFRVFLIYYDYPNPGETTPSEIHLALPKQEVQEINSFIFHTEHQPLAVYEPQEG